MFEYSLNIHQTIFFNLLTTTSDIKIHTAEYYFSKKYYPQALEIFLELTEEEEPTAALYQKTGFSYQKSSQLKEALEAYIKADMITPDDLWTVKKIALCYRLSGNYEKALDQYKHLDFLQPGKYNTKMQIANCLIALQKYKEALQVYAELEKTEVANENLWRAISWCAFISGNIHQAAYYNEKIISVTPNATDYLNAAHIAFCKKQRAVAIDLYRKCMTEQNNNLELLMSQILNDKLYLKANGIQADEISLLMDELSFLSE
jgi:tetratricopeptide (TPR) repeat protein